MTKYRMNTPSIISETLDGEVVILNLDKGVYYSLGGVGTHLWEMVTSGMNVQEMAGYFEPRDSLEVEIQAFINELLQNELIIADANQKTSLYKVEETLTFAKPVLHVYEDMKELLLLDPIHEVDQSGWPIAP